MSRLDDAIGEGIERLVRVHHRRRLGRIGHGGALAPDGSVLWTSGDPPPRRDNSFELLIDGAEALPAMAQAIEGARERVHLTGWHADPDFLLRRDGSTSVLRDLLAETARRAEVRVLLWAGAPLPLYHPSRSQLRAVRGRLAAATGVRCALDAQERPLHCHHEKLLIVDDRVAFVGGIDLTTLAGDRFDTQQHHLRAGLGWHDVAVRLRGPAVSDVARHFAARWTEVAGEPLTPPARQGPAGDVEVQVVQTVPEGLYRFAPRGRFRILEAYLRALRSARRLVYLENQYLWSPEIVAVLREKLRRPPEDAFRLVVLLPERPKGGGDDTRGQLGALAAADAGAGRFLACTVAARAGGSSAPVYVHAKVGVVDDAWLAVGSANLNEHSLFNDTEVDVITCDPAVARSARLRLWAEHLERSEAEVAGDPRRLVDEVWRPVADEGLARQRAGAPLTHRLVRLPESSRRVEGLRGPLQSLLVDG